MEKHYDFRKKLLQVHQPDRINDAIWKQLEGVVVNDEWTIWIPDDAKIVLRNAAKDLQNYFRISMKRNLKIVAAHCDLQIRLYTSLTNEKQTYRISVENNKIILNGTNEKMTAQAAYALEDLMNFNEGPVIPIMDELYTPMFSPRIIQSGLGDGLFPDEHLNAIVHAGFTAIKLSFHGVLTDENRRKEVNDVIMRASNYGLDVYTSTHFKNLRHPSDPDAWEHYDSMYGELFRCCPGLKGIFIVGEACEFPSHDDRTTGKPWRESIHEEKPSPGWFPCNDYPEFVTLLRDVIQHVKPSAEITLWSYNWGYVEEELRVALINSMPTDGISMMATYELDESFSVKPGVQEFTADYTLWFPGPSKYFSSEATAAAARGLNFMTMCNTGGNTWDIGVVPYLPAPGQWFKRYEGIVHYHNSGTLNGLYESHTYGYWPSFIPELSKAAFTYPQANLSELLRKIAIRDYGFEHAESVLKAWHHFDRGMQHCVSTNEDQYGPCRIGPAYPLFFKKWEKLPIGPESNRDPNSTCCPVYRFNPDEMERLVYEIQEYEAMASEFKEGNDIISELLPLLPTSKQLHAKEAWTVSKFIENTARTTYNVKKWHKAKIHLGVYVDHEAIWTGGRHDMSDALSPVKPLDIREDKEYWILQLLSIGNAEIENAMNTIPLLEDNSRLGYNQELDYCGSKEQVLWKIEKLQITLETEVKPLLQVFI